MGDPLEFQIYDNIESQLERIQKSNLDVEGNAFRTDVAEVVRDIPSYHEVKQFPSVGFMPEQTRIQSQPFSCNRMMMPILVMGYVRTKKGDVRAMQLATTKLRDDIFAAIMNDITRGGNASGTFPRSLTGDDGLKQQEGMVALRFEVLYFRTDGITAP